MAAIKGIMHINITIAPGPEALAEARRFYIEGLGLQELDRPVQTDNGRPGYWLACGPGQQVHISAEPQAESYNGPSGRHSAFEVEDITGLKQQLIKAGVTVQDGMQFEGLSRFFARDPWGNRLEFVEPHKGN